MAVMPGSRRGEDLRRARQHAARSEPRGRPAGRADSSRS